MDLRSAGGSPSVEVPTSAADRPSWTKVGVMAAIGFVVGVAWPRLAGVRLGPSVPEASPSTLSPVSSADPAAASAASSMQPPTAAVVVPSAVAPSPAIAPASVVATPSHGTVYACKSATGESLHPPACGGLPGIDSVVMPRLRKLSECPAAAGLSGSVHFVVRVDFERGLSVTLGRNRAGVATPEPVLACAKTAMLGANLASLAHDNPRYSVSYAVAFVSDAQPASESAAPSSAPAPRDGVSQTAEVEWDAAVVRDEPKTGKIVARLPRGSTLHLGPIKDGWYPVKYGDGFSSDGWVYRGAIGR